MAPFPLQRCVAWIVETQYFYLLFTIAAIVIRVDQSQSRWIFMSQSVWTSPLRVHMKMEMDTITTEMFITAIEGHPILYDMSSKRYHDQPQDRKNNVWHSISADFSNTGTSTFIWMLTSCSMYWIGGISRDCLSQISNALWKSAVVFLEWTFHSTSRF